MNKSTSTKVLYISPFFCIELRWTLTEHHRTFKVELYKSQILFRFVICGHSLSAPINLFPLITELPKLSETYPLADFLRLPLIQRPFGNLVQ